MATYAELIQAAQNGTLTDKVRVACVIAATTIMAEAPATSNHANRLLWAKSVFADSDREMRRMLWAVLGINNALTLAQITGASDSAVQTAVNQAIDVFANGQA